MANLDSMGFLPALLRSCGISFTTTVIPLVDVIDVTLAAISLRLLTTFWCCCFAFSTFVSFWDDQAWICSMMNQTMATPVKAPTMTKHGSICLYESRSKVVSSPSTAVPPSVLTTLLLVHWFGCSRYSGCSSNFVVFPLPRAARIADENCRMM